MDETLSVLDEFEIRVFEYLSCPGCAHRMRLYIEDQLADGTIALEQVPEIEIIVKDEYEYE